MIPELHENIVSYIGRYTTLKKVSTGEYAGPCPVCGGEKRFKVADKKGWFCRHCTGDPGSGGHWGDLADFTKFAFGWSLKETLHQFNLDRRATPEEIERITAERKAREAQERAAEQAKQAIVHDRLTAAHEWQTYNANLNRYPEAREMWHERGLSDEWIAYYGVGYSPSREFCNGDKVFVSASLTIPYLRPVYTPNPEGGSDVTWKAINIKHRLLADETPGGKYRPHLSGAGSHLFFTELFQQNIFGDLLIVEGEIKAMVTWSALWAGAECFAPNVTVIGIPGQSWKDEWLEQFNRAERVFVCLDPDAQASAKKLADRITDRPVKNILLPDKIDDLITMGVLDGFKLLEILES